MQRPEQQPQAAASQELSDVPGQARDLQAGRELSALEAQAQRRAWQQSAPRVRLQPVQRQAWQQQEDERQPQALLQQAAQQKAALAQRPVAPVPRPEAQFPAQPRVSRQHHQRQR